MITQRPSDASSRAALRNAERAVATASAGAVGSAAPTRPDRLAGLRRLGARWSALPRRQQCLVLGAIAVAALGATDALVLAPSDREQRALRTQLSTLQQQAARAQADATRQATVQQALKAEEAELRRRLDSAEQAIAAARTTIAGPSELRERIRDLSQDGAVRLVALHTLAPEPVQVGASAPPAAPPAATPAGPTGSPDGRARSTLYRYPIQVSVDGSYAALRDYLARLEGSDDGLHWHSVSLDNRNWPAVRLELRLFVLGDQPLWKGP